MADRPRPVHPAWLMIGFWGLLYAAYLAAPITQTPALSAGGTTFVVASIGLFMVAALMASGRTIRSRSGIPMIPRQVMPAALDRRVGSLLAIGVCGGLLGLYAKAMSVDLLTLAGSAALRSERAQQLLGAEEVVSGALAAVSFLTYPAGFAGVVALLLRYEQHSSGPRALALAFMPVAFAQSIAAGGRSTVLVLLLLVVLASYVRRIGGLKGIPASRALRLVIAGLALAFGVYSLVIWQVRSDLAQLDLDAFLIHAEDSWGVTPNRSLEAMASRLGEPGLVQSVMSTIFYLTQCLSVVERILAMPDSPVLLGGYHIDVVAAALRAWPGGATFLSDGYAKLLDANVYGFFAGAWGALLIDFGWMGGAAAVFAWGWLAGSAFRRMVRDPVGSRPLLYVFWLYSVLISFVSPPFGFSNSALTFLWFIVLARLIDRRSARRGSRRTRKLAPPMTPSFDAPAR